MMMSFKELSEATETEVLVAFFDLTQFARFATSRTSREVFETLSAYFEFIGDVVAEGGGTVVKFIGDAGLLVYPAERVDTGVMSLRKLQEEGDAWLQRRGIPCRNVIKAHFGAVTCGPIGTRHEKSFEVYGETVNIAALLRSDGLAITPQVFRKLHKDTRRFFKKHTPPVTYIPVEQRHRE
jgi:adenylate cyclase